MLSPMLSISEAVCSAADSTEGGSSPGSSSREAGVPPAGVGGGGKSSGVPGLEVVLAAI